MFGTAKVKTLTAEDAERIKVDQPSIFANPFLQKQTSKINIHLKNRKTFWTGMIICFSGIIEKCSIVWPIVFISRVFACQAMTSIEDLPADERKRQREAFRRRLAQPGLRPGLIQKWQACHDQQSKFKFLQAFMLDPQCLGSIQIEAEYVNQAEHEDSSQWAELPLSTLRKQFTSPEEKAFLENQVVGKQSGREHPQDPSNPEMRLYWIYRETTDTTKNLQRVGNRLSGKGNVPANKAAVQACVDGITGFASDFGKGKGAPEPTVVGKGKGKGKTKSGEPPEKKRKAHLRRKLFAWCPTCILLGFVNRGFVNYNIWVYIYIYIITNFILYMVLDFSFLKDHTNLNWSIFWSCNFPLNHPWTSPSSKLAQWRFAFLGRWNPQKRSERRTSAKSWRSHTLKKKYGNP